MTYDPFQTSSVMGAYAGPTNPFQNPYQGIAGFGGVNPQQLQQQQLAQILAARAVISQLLAQNPLLALGLENPLLNPILAHSQFGQQQHLPNPQIGQGVPQFGQGAPQFGPQFGQIGSPYGGQVPPMLAPQSWVGQRGFYGAGIGPWTGF